MSVINFADSDGATQGASHARPFPVVPAAELARTAVTPEVLGAPQASQLWDAGSSNLIYDYRLTVNATDSIEAGARLLNGYPDTSVLLPGETLAIHADSAITRLDIVASGSAATHSAAGGTILIGTSTEANTRAAMQTFTFDSGDDVRTVIVTALALFGSSRYCRTHIEGRANG